MFMSKRAVSLTLDEANLVWLRGLTVRSGARSLSQTVDQIVTAARAQPGGASRAVASVAGTIDLPADDPHLERADAAIRSLFAESVSRPFLVRERKPGFRSSRRRRG